MCRALLDFSMIFNFLVELRRHGVRVPLVGQPLRILHILLQNPERVVTRDELRDALWPGDVHVVFDGALNTAVRKLRLSLEDNPAEERYIQTVPRLGYRFVGPIEVLKPAETPVEIPAPPVVSRHASIAATGQCASSSLGIAIVCPLLCLSVLLWRISTTIPRLSNNRWDHRRLAISLRRIAE